jgi:hypothetical protein
MNGKLPSVIAAVLVVLAGIVGRGEAKDLLIGANLPQGVMVPRLAT